MLLRVQWEKDLQEELCTCGYTGCIAEISLGTQNSSAEGALFCPDVSITGSPWLLVLDSGEFYSQQVFTSRFCLQSKALCAVLVEHRLCLRVLVTQLLVLPRTPLPVVWAQQHLWALGISTSPLTWCVVLAGGCGSQLSGFGSDCCGCLTCSP